MKKNSNSKSTVIARIEALRELIRKATIAQQWVVVERAERELYSFGGKL